MYFKLTNNFIFTFFCHSHLKPPPMFFYPRSPSKRRSYDLPSDGSPVKGTSFLVKLQAVKYKNQVSEKYLRIFFSSSAIRSEERRVGKECRYRWARDK